MHAERYHLEGIRNSSLCTYLGTYKLRAYKYKIHNYLLKKSGKLNFFTHIYEHQILVNRLKDNNPAPLKLHINFSYLS